MFTHTKPRYTISDSLGLLGIGRSRLYADINAGKLSTYKIGKRRFINPAAIDRYVEECEKEAQQ
jgi:excisionase family DNA binding protein